MSLVKHLGPGARPDRLDLEGVTHLGWTPRLGKFAQAGEEWPAGTLTGRVGAGFPPRPEVTRCAGLRARDCPVTRAGTVGVLYSVSPSSDSGAPALDFVRNARGGSQAERDGLLRNGRLLEELLDTVDDGVVLWDEDWRYLYTNAANSRILGVPEEKLLGQRLWDVLPGTEDTEFGRAYRRVMEAGGSERLEAYDPPIEKWVEALVFRTSAGVGVVVRDVTDRHRAAETLSQTAEMERRVSAIVSHDLRNPLASLNVGIEVLLRRVTERTEDVTTLERMRRSVARMQEIIVGLLDAARGDGNGSGMPIERAEVDLRAVLEHVVDELRSVAGQSRILLEADGSARGAFDGVRLSQAVSNLVTNALQHGSATEPVTIRLRAAPEGPRLEVHNHGPPIPESLRPLLFRPFTRGPDADRTEGSVGLGLFIVQQIATAHGGTVEVDLHIRRGHHLPAPAAVERSSLRVRRARAAGRR